MHIVNLALGVVQGYNRKESIEGIHLCITHLITTIQRKYFIFNVPVSKENIGNLIKTNKLEDIISQSLIYSVIEFRDHLNEHHSGLSKITCFKLVGGFELVCLWASQGISLNSNENDWIVTRDNSDFTKYMY